MLTWLVRRAHNEVPILVTVQGYLFRNLVPGYELRTFLVDDHFLGWLHVGSIHVEANHAADQVHSNLLLPSFLGSLKSYLDSGLLIRFDLQLQVESRVGRPRELVCLLLEGLMVQMAPSS